MKSVVSIAPTVAAKRYISLYGCAHHVILAVSFFDRQYLQPVIAGRASDLW